MGCGPASTGILLPLLKYSAPMETNATALPVASTIAILTTLQLHQHHTHLRNPTQWPLGGRPSNVERMMLGFENRFWACEIAAVRARMLLVSSSP
jgi:hypothetical protein